jgi:hypothetical protein
VLFTRIQQKPLSRSAHDPITLSGCGRSRFNQGYKNRPNFLKFGENWWNRAGPNFKTAEFTVHCFKISEKDKSQQKICKKTRSNSKVTSEEIFVKHSRLDW